MFMFKSTKKLLIETIQQQAVTIANLLNQIKIFSEREFELKRKNNQLEDENARLKRRLKNKGDDISNAKM